jgi:hypothetical protein
MSYQPRKNPLSPAALLAGRRAEILMEYRHWNLEPVRIGGEPISMELALLLGLIVDLSQQAAE